MTKVWQRRIRGITALLGGATAAALMASLTWEWGMFGPALTGVAFTCGIVFTLKGFSRVEKKQSENRKQAAKAEEKKQQADLGSCFDIVRVLSDQVSRTPGAEKTKAKECITLCAKILHAISTDANKKKAVPVFLNEYLRPAELTLNTYLRLSQRQLNIASEALKNAEENVLPGLAQRLELFYNNIHLGDITHLATAEAVLEVNKSHLTAEAQVELGLDR